MKGFFYSSPRKRHSGKSRNLIKIWKITLYLLKLRENYFGGANEKLQTIFSDLKNTYTVFICFRVKVGLVRRRQVSLLVHRRCRELLPQESRRSSRVVPPPVHRHDYQLEEVASQVAVAGIIITSNTEEAGHPTLNDIVKHTRVALATAPPVLLDRSDTSNPITNLLKTIFNNSY